MGLCLGSDQLVVLSPYPGDGCPRTLVQGTPGGDDGGGPWADEGPWCPHCLSLSLQVMGLGLSGVFALCLGHTSSFCTSVVFASASIGLQTFNHR